VLYTNEEYKYLKRKGIDPDAFRAIYKIVKGVFGDGVFICSAEVKREKEKVVLR
jgi:hypothetical protein